MEREEFIQAVYNIQHEDEESAIDLIYDEIDNMLDKGYFYHVDRILAMIEVHLLTDQSMLSFLTITRSAKEELQARGYFFAQVKDFLHKKHSDEEYVNSLLKGLE